MGKKRTYSDEDVILAEGTPDKYLYLVLKGSVTLYMNYQKKGELVIGVCGVGKSFGEMGVLIHKPSIYTVVAFGDVEVAMFTEDELNAFVQSYPDRALGIIQNFAKIIEVLNKNCQMLVEEVTKYTSDIEVLHKSLDNMAQLKTEIFEEEAKSKEEADAEREEYLKALRETKWHSSIGKKPTKAFKNFNKPS